MTERPHGTIFNETELRLMHLQNDAQERDRALTIFDKSGDGKIDNGMKVRRLVRAGESGRSAFAEAEFRALNRVARSRIVMGAAGQSQAFNPVLMPDGSYVTAVSPKVVERATRVANNSLHRVLGELNIELGKSRGPKG